MILDNHNNHTLFFQSKSNTVMKSTFFKILKYTSILILIIILNKILFQNQLFDNDYSNPYLITMTVFKLSLFLLTLFFLRHEKITISKFNKTKYLLIIVGVIVFVRLYYNVSSKSVELKLDIDYCKLTFYSLLNFSIGLFEEFYFRLFVFSLLCSFYKKNLFKISILTSLLFAIVHLNNLLLNSYTLSDVLFQVFFAFSIGMLFQVLFINYKNIYIPVLIHFFIDFNSNFSEKFFNVTPIGSIDEGFDNTTFGIVSTFILISMVFTYFNLKKKEVTFFIIEKPNK